LTKDEAKQEALRRWRALPEEERRTHDQAQVFAASLADELDFRTMGNERKVISAWLVRELEGKTEVETPGGLDSVNGRSKGEADDSAESNRQGAAVHDDQGRSRAGSHSPLQSAGGA
jgi:hypothetical protein